MERWPSANTSASDTASSARGESMAAAVMAALRAQYAATLDMAKAGPIVKAKLSA